MAANLLHAEDPDSSAYLQELLMQLQLADPDIFGNATNSSDSDADSDAFLSENNNPESSSENTDEDTSFVYDESLLPVDYNKVCSICLSSWNIQSIAHYPVMLKCKHIFGFRCIREWLNQKSKAGLRGLVNTLTCPLCKKAAKIDDMKRVESPASCFMSIQEELEEERKNESKINAQNIRGALNKAGFKDSEIDDWVASELHDKFEVGLEGKWWASREVIIDTKLLNFFINIQFFVDNVELFKKHIDTDENSESAKICKNETTLKIIDVLLEM